MAMSLLINKKQMTKVAVTDIAKAKTKLYMRGVRSYNDES